MTVLLIGNYEHDRSESMGRFEGLLAHELATQGIEVERLRPKPVFGALKPGVHGLGKWLGYLDKFIIFPWRLRRKVASLTSDQRASLLVHICDHSNAYYAYFLRGIPHLVTCHDLLAIRSASGEVPQNPTRTSGRLLQKIIRRGLAKAQYVACVSNATREQLQRLIPRPEDSTYVIYNGFNHAFRHLKRTAAIEHLQDTGHAGLRKCFADATTRYFLHVGGNQWYKNRPGVLAAYFAWRTIAPDDVVKLIMVGKEPTPGMRALLTLHPERAADIHFITGVSDVDLEALYNAAEALLFLSIEEGFGWPIIEAHACGCPVLTTHRAPMTEVGGEAALYCEAEDATGAARRLGELIDMTSEARAWLVEFGLKNAERFTTERMIAEYLTLYQKISGNKTLHRSASRDGRN